MAMFCKPIFRKNVMRSVPVNGDESHRVATNFKDNLITLPSSGIETLYDVAKYAFDTVRSLIYTTWWDLRHISLLSAYIKSHQSVSGFA